MHLCARARMRSAVATSPPAPLPTFAPTLLGGTAREPGCTCAPFESVRARDSALRHVACLRALCNGARACICVHACRRVRACVRAGVCVCGPSRGTAGTGGIYRSARRWPCVRFAFLSPRSGRRQNLQQPHPQGGMGGARKAHVRGRRRLRRHLRHRRLQGRHLLQRRLGEHRRRCAGRTRSGGGRGGALGGYYGGTKGYYRGTKGYYMGTYRLPRGCLGGTQGVLMGYSGASTE